VNTWGGGRGKSDAEVNLLYDAKSRATRRSPRNRSTCAGGAEYGQGAQAVKDVTGKSLEEMENMSDEELEALVVSWRRNTAMST